MTAPANDDFANAVVISATGDGSDGPVTIDDATIETGEPTSEVAAQSVWWKFTAANDGTATFSTYGSLAGDFDSGDGYAGAGSFGFLDTQMGIWRQDGTGFAGLVDVAGNDDHPGTTEPHAAEGDYWSYIELSVTAGETYYIQVGTFDAAYVGTVVLTWSFPGGPPPLVEIGECPPKVSHIRHGTSSVTTYPNIGTAGSYTNGTIDWYEPQHVPRQLLLWVYYGTKVDVAAPSGYTEVFNEVWDNAPVVSPFNGADGPFYHATAQVLVAYRIAAETWTSGDASTIVGTISGVKYGDGGFPEVIGEEGGSVDVYLYECDQMGGDYPRIDFDPDPVKVGTLTTQSARLIDDGGDYLDSTERNSVTLSPVSADYDGNHVWLDVYGFHGIALDYTPYDDSPIERDGVKRITSPDPGAFHNGDRYNESGYVAYSSDTIIFDGSPMFADTFAPTGVRTLDLGPGDVWADGFSGTEGVDYKVWSVLGGAFALEIVVQSPPTTRPFNDDIADAYTVPQCPITIVECAFGATLEGGESVPDGVGGEGSLWFKWTPTDDETGVLVSTGVEASDPSLGDFPPYGTEYDTLLAVYSGSPGSLTLIASNDDIAFPDVASEVTIDVTGGTTYYIQVSGRGGDEGRLLLTLDCRNQTLVADIWGWGGENGEGWHIVLGVPTG